MNREELYEKLDIETGEDFQYFENFADLAESGEEIDEDALYGLFDDIDMKTFAELAESFFYEMEDSIPDDQNDLVMLTENIKRCLVGLSEAVERGEVPSELIRRYVGEMTAEGADVIVLGCTHFPFLQEEVERAAGPGVRIINPAPAVARQTARVLHSPAEGGGTAVFYSTGDTTVLKSTVLSIDSAVNPGNFYHVTI